MRFSERAVIYSAVAIALYLGGAAFMNSQAGLSAQARQPIDTTAEAAKQPGAKAPIIAVADVYKVASKLVGKPRFSAIIEDKRKVLKDRITPVEKELRDLAEKLQAMGPDAKGPEAEVTARAYQSKQQEYIRLGQQLDKEMETTIAQVNFDAYKQVVEAATAIAEKKGYTILLASRSMDDMKTPEQSQGFIQALLARPVLKSPGADDLTADIMADLKVE